MFGDVNITNWGAHPCNVADFDSSHAIVLLAYFICADARIGTMEKKKKIFSYPPWKFLYVFCFMYFV